MQDAQRAMMAQSLGGNTPVIRRGARGENVAALQQFLAARGYDVGATDGIFGRRTEEAVKQFQLESGIGVDGRVGPETMAAAQRVSDSPPIPVSRPDPMGQPVEAPSGNPQNAMMGGDQMRTPYGPSDGASDMLDARPDNMNVDMSGMVQNAPEPIPPNGYDLSPEEWLDAKEASWGSPEGVPSDGTQSPYGGGNSSDDLARAIDAAKAYMSGQDPSNVRAGRRINEYTGGVSPGDGQDELRAAMLRSIMGQGGMAAR